MITQGDGCFRDNVRLPFTVNLTLIPSTEEFNIDPKKKSIQ